MRDYITNLSAFSCTNWIYYLSKREVFVACLGQCTVLFCKQGLTIAIQNTIFYKVCFLLTILCQCPQVMTTFSTSNGSRSTTQARPCCPTLKTARGVGANVSSAFDDPWMPLWSGHKQNENDLPTKTLTSTMRT